MIEILAVILRYLPGVLGALLVSFGAYMVNAALGLVVAGAFLIALDRKIT